MTDTTITPTTEQEQRAKWDLLLRDIDLRGEQLRQAPVEMRERLAGIDAALADGAMKREQLAQMKTFPVRKYEGWKLAFAGMTAGAAFVTAGGALTALLLHFAGRLS